MMEREITGILGRYRPGRALSSISRYDLLLAAIPVAFLGAVLAATALGVPLEAALLAAAVVGGFVLFDALFRRPPTRLGGPGAAGGRR